MKTYLIATAILLTAECFAQNSLDSLIVTIERNSTALQASLKRAEAEKYANNTGKYLSNPELEIGYLLGNPSSLGERTNISIKQSFDFPTAYFIRGNIASMKDEQSQSAYLSSRQEILLQAKLLCTELVYRNALVSEYSRQAADAKRIGQAYQSRYERGDIGIIDYRKAMLHHLTAENAVATQTIERAHLLESLQALNGGIAIKFEDTAMTLSPVPEFESWYADAEQTNPGLQRTAQEMNIAERQQSLSRAQTLPKFSLGYLGEYSGDSKFNGISAGISIPLWENKNSVQHAKAHMQSAQSAEADLRLQLRHELKALHARLISLIVSTEQYRAGLNSLDNSKTLTKALYLGEISITEYLLETASYFDAKSELLSMERLLNRAAVELSVHSR